MNVSSVATPPVQSEPVTTPPPKDPPQGSHVAQVTSPPPPVPEAPYVVPPKEIKLEDYASPCFEIPEIALTFDLGETNTTITSKMQVKWSYGPSTLVLDGEKRDLERVLINGEPCKYKQLENKLVIYNVPNEFELEICSRIDPSQNKSASGLYISDGVFGTHCEPESFRKITYHLDRPDVLTKYDVTLIADKTKFPTLLSNGDCVEDRDVEGGKHLKRFVDEIPKPSYLFAIVAGDLVCLEDSFTTMHGKEVKLQIFATAKYETGLQHAMDALKHVMKWDEETYGRYYRHNELKVVALDDFNAGACECTGLIMFNAACLVARSEWTVDHSFEFVAKCMIHEYIHYWNGNAITVRTWHELALKEGSTVFKEQECSAHLLDAEIARVENAAFVSTRQFPEDGGPLAHPVLPPSYKTPRNSYTLTTYMKGAEVFRMLKTLLGAERFHAGFTAYYEKFDGQAVSIEDFIATMEETSGADLKQFRRWIHQAGTPEVSVEIEYDEDSKQAKLKVKQSCKETADGSPKEPFHIPLALQLYSIDGEPLLAREMLLEITEESQEFVFEYLESRPVPSLLRGFSAPVRVNYNYTEEELCMLLTSDSDLFVRDFASTELFKGELSDKVIEAFRTVLNSDIPPAHKAQLLQYPTAEKLIEGEEIFDIHEGIAQGEAIVLRLATALEKELERLFLECAVKEPYAPTPEQIGKRSLQLLCMRILAEGAEDEFYEKLAKLALKTDNLTVKSGCIATLLKHEASQAQGAVEAYLKEWKENPILQVPSVYQEYLRIVALFGTVDDVKRVLESEEFDISVPNNVFALIRTFTANVEAFYALDGRGFKFLADQILVLEKLGNRELAAMLATKFSQYQKLPEELKEKMGSELDRLLANPSLTTGTRDNLTKIKG